MRCHHCNSPHLIKSGARKNARGQIRQQYKCKDCGGYSIGGVKR